MQPKSRFKYDFQIRNIKNQIYTQNQITNQNSSNLKTCNKKKKIKSKWTKPKKNILVNLI